MFRRWPILAAMALLWTAALAQADSWMPAEEFTTPSENGRFQARVVPKTQTRPAQLIVLKSDARGQEPLWTTALANDVCPLAVLLSDDGQHAVTFDNWGNAGYGDDVLAFYDAAGLRTKYSLEKLLAALGLDVRLGGFEHSVSSRWWREKSIAFLSQYDEELYVCIWLGWVRHWAAWDVASGQSAKISPEQERLWNRIARAKSLDTIDRGKYRVPAIHFLAWLKNPEDLDILEKQLHSTDFSVSFTTREGGSDGSPPERYFTASSLNREAADLARAGDRGDRRDGIYANLGSVHGVVRLPHKPRSRSGGIWICLIPESIARHEWAKSPPEHRACISLSAFGDHIRDTTLAFRFEGIQPGRYWVKVVFDAAEPYCDVEEAAAICTPHNGDYESEQGPVVEAAKGRISQAATIDCRTLVRKSR